MRNLVLFSNKNTPMLYRSLSYKPKRILQKDLISDAVNNLDLKKFREIVMVCKFRGTPPASLQANDKPILIDICSKLYKDYKISAQNLRIYRHMLELLTDTITPEHYSEWYEFNSPLILLSKTNEITVAWYLNKILAANKPRINSVAVGINGAEDRSKPYYGWDIPIVHATQAQSYWGLQVLLHHGANPNIKDANKKTPLDYAQGKNPRIIELLKNAGAHVKIGMQP